MTSYGVSINLGKSVISNNGSFDFAKVSSFKGQTVSAIPFRMLISNNTRLGRISNLIYLLKTIKVPNIVSYMDRVLKNRKSERVDMMFNYIGALSMFLSSKRISYSDLLKALTSFSPLVKGRSHLSRHVSTLNSKYLSNLFVSLIKGLPLELSNDDRVEHVYQLDSHFHRETLIDKLLSFKDEKTFDTLQLNLTTEIFRKLRDPNFPDAFDIVNELVFLSPGDREEFQVTYGMVCN